jgi:multidrug resistance efflux pump
MPVDATKPRTPNKEPEGQEASAVEAIAAAPRSEGAGDPAPQPVVRAPREDPEVGRLALLQRRERAAAERRRLLLVMVPWAKRLATLCILLVAALAALVTWDFYVMAPWTRDGRIRVQVASIAPQVSGQITELRVADNQFVHRGEVLYVVDPFDFEAALRSDQALMQEKAADLQVKRVQSDRRQHMSNSAASTEEQQIYAGTAVQAKAAFDAARERVVLAEINLRRTEVRSPVNGYVTNLLVHIGDYAHQGTANITVIDSDSYWIDGYFEETKLARICMGDRVEAKLMGYAQPITGHIATVTRGISVSNAATSAQGLPNVDAVYTWVRLAQRIPIRVAIDDVPQGVPLVSGLTATVTILPPKGSDRPRGFDRLIETAKMAVTDVFAGPRARSACIPAVTTERGLTQTLPPEERKQQLSPGRINPGLVPGMNDSPRNR